MNHERSKEGMKESHVPSVAFHFMQIISLPNVPVQELFCSHEITVNAFYITNIKENKGVLYVYHEGECRKIKESRNPKFFRTSTIPVLYKTKTKLTGSF